MFVGKPLPCLITGCCAKASVMLFEQLMSLQTGGLPLTGLRSLGYTPTFVKFSSGSSFPLSTSQLRPSLGPGRHRVVGIMPTRGSSREG